VDEPTQTLEGQVQPVLVEARPPGLGYDPGRPGPPLILGIIVLLLAPVVWLGLTAKAAITHLDLEHTGIIGNREPVLLYEGSTYLFATEAQQPGKRDCVVRLRNGPKISVSSVGVAEAGDAVMWGDDAYVPRGSFYTETTGQYIVNCPRAGATLLSVPIKGTTSELGLEMGKGLLAGGLVGLLGLLMIIFRRKKPRERRY